MSYKARVPLASVSPSGQNPRRDFGDVSALARSIAATGGQPVNPIVVADDGDGPDGMPVYRIVDGERRYRALLELGAGEADVLVCSDWSEAEDAVAMMATDDKKSLTEEERARGFQGMLMLGVADETVSGASGVDVESVRRVRRMTRSRGFEAPEQASLDALIEASAFDDPRDRARVLAAADPRCCAAQIREKRAAAESRDALIPLMEASLPSLEWRSGRPPRQWDHPGGLAFVAFVRTAADVDALASRRAGDPLVAWPSEASWSVWREVDEAAESRAHAEAEADAAASREALREFLADVARWLCRLGAVPRDVAALVREGRSWHPATDALGLAPSIRECPADPDLALAMDSDPSLYEALRMLGLMRDNRGIRSWADDGPFDDRDAERADDLWQAAVAGGWDPARCEAMAAELAAWRASEVGS